MRKYVWRTIGNIIKRLNLSVQTVHTDADKNTKLMAQRQKPNGDW